MFGVGHLINGDIIGGRRGWRNGGDGPDRDNKLINGRPVCFESTFDQFHVGIELEQ